MLTSVLRIIRLGVEYKDAVQAAVDKANAGGSSADVIRTFADSTGTKLDDRAVESLIGFVEDFQKKLPELDQSKDALLEAIQTYWPLFKERAHKFLDAADQGVPEILKAARSLLVSLEARVQDIEGLFATADIALQLVEEQLEDLTRSSSTS